MSGSEEENSINNSKERCGQQQEEGLDIPFLDSYTWCLTSKSEDGVWNHSSGYKTNRDVSTNRSLMSTSEDEVKHNFVWRIEKFRESLFLCFMMSSPDFSVKIGDGLVSNWNLWLRINDEHNVSVILHNKEKRFDATLKYHFLMDGMKIYFSEGRSKVISKWFPDENLTIVCYLSFKIPDGARKNSSGCKRNRDDGVSINQLQQQLTAFAGQAHLSPDLSDCKIVCEGEELSCHTFMLAARSPVFRAMFTTAWVKEATTRRVEIDSMKLEVVKDMISFLYTGVKPELSTGDEGAVEQLLDAAEQYQIDDLKVICEDRLISKMKVDNAVDRLILGDRYAAQNLKKEAICFILRNMTKVVDTASWKEKLYKLPNLMTEILLAEKNRDDQGPSASKRPRI